MTLPVGAVPPPASRRQRMKIDSDDGEGRQSTDLNYSAYTSG
jgi:hypothetical protein